MLRRRARGPCTTTPRRISALTDSGAFAFAPPPLPGCCVRAGPMRDLRPWASLLPRMAPECSRRATDLLTGKSNRAHGSSAYPPARRVSGHAPQQRPGVSADVRRDHGGVGLVRLGRPYAGAHAPRADRRRRTGAIGRAHRRGAAGRALLEHCGSRLRTRRSPREGHGAVLRSQHPAHRGVCVGAGDACDFTPARGGLYPRCHGDASRPRREGWRRGV